MRSFPRAILFCSLLVILFSAAGYSNDLTNLGEMVVTGSRSAQALRNVSATMQIFTNEQMDRSPAQSVTEFLSENAVGFFSEWSPGQTSITMRGVRSDGQGRDFKSGVLVLINGRRAGTANLSKLSLDQVSRIEIIRGPASVSYGSQAMGGVINLITCNGHNASGGKIDVSAGSFEKFKGDVGYGGDVNDTLSGYVGINGETRDDYDGGSGSSTQVNTAYDRYGGLAALNWTPNPINGLDVTVRSDGVYDVGFRGSSYDLDNNEDRYNQSIDLQHQLELEPFNATLNTQAFVFKDVDDFRWGSETAGYDIDNITREQKGFGLKVNPEVEITHGTLLLVGADVDYSELRSDRYRYGTAGPVSQTAPYDMNQDVMVLSGFGEINQFLLADRMNISAGLRYTHNDLSLVDTPYQSITGEREVTTSHVTYSAGLSYNFSDGIKSRASYATGFRTPTGAELAGEYTPVLTPNAITRGNADLDPESSAQFEVGLTVAMQNYFVDLAFFDNTITDRITKPLYSDDGTTTVYQYANNSGDAHIQGVDLQAQVDFAPIFNFENSGLLLTLNGTYNFTMQEEGAESADSGPNADKVQRMSEYQGMAAITYSWRKKWSLSFISTLYGPMYYDTEEHMTSANQSASDYVHEKDSFTLCHLRGMIRLSEGFSLYGGINNLFDENYHPMFINIDDGNMIVDTSRTNGGYGNSMPGRNYYAGITYRF